MALLLQSAAPGAAATASPTAAAAAAATPEFTRAAVSIKKPLLRKHMEI